MRRASVLTVLLAAVFCGSSVVALPAAEVMQSSADGIYTEAQAKRGAPLYTEHCSPCHGGDLGGTDFGPSLGAAELRSRWKYRTLGELFSLMQSTMPVFSPGGLSAQQNADILAYILQRNKFPAGTQELSSRVDVLNALQMDRVAPNATQK